MQNKLNKQLTVKISERAENVLKEIKAKHRYEPTEVVRGLLDSLIVYWYQRKCFSFPVQIKDGYLVGEEMNSHAFGLPTPKQVMWSTDLDFRPLTAERLAELDEECEAEKKKKRKPRSA